ncbi:MAG: DUF6176 family protein, partial [Pseudomonadales bacterium]|nr:DUF6176 family protein [Pseudomonadales bacterium]
METSGVVIELKPDSLERVREWAAYLNQHKDEALQTLKNEGVMLESWFLTKIDGKDYLFAFMRAESMERAREAVKNSSFVVDAYHQQFKKDAWLTRFKGELLVDFS